ncbi:MAG: YceD family protein [Chromatiales bacterium]|jgi:uncharacterized protein
MSAALPNRVDALRLADRAERVEGLIDLGRAERLAEVAAGRDAEARLSLRFSRDAGGVAGVQGEIIAELWPQCQRCLEPYALRAEVRVELALVESDAEAKRLMDSGRDSLVLSDGWIDLLELVEDELLLALPLIPMHPSADQCSPEVRAVMTAPAERKDEEAEPGPFAALAALKKTD